ncbi:MAG: hypothetical protein Fur0024_0710 [Patescibacteria group bacterium]
MIRISKEICEILEIYKPDLVHIERQFFFRNVNNVFRIAEAKGVLLLEIFKRNLEVIEFTPLQMKSVIANDGHAKKPQILKSVMDKLHLTEKIKPDDACDAVAFAMMNQKMLDDKKEKKSFKKKVNKEE